MDEYIKEETTYFLTPIEEIGDNVKIEIGDSKQPDFKPQIKLTRWDNEVNLSVRLLDEVVVSETTVDNKIEVSLEDKQIDIYQIPETKEIKNGASEFEITLFNKPQSNVIRFSVQSKELDFFYQPEITDEEASPLAERKVISLLEAKRIIRPENVVGSYAVYHKTKKNFISGQNNYGSGKAFHIYRPRIEDSSGKWVWGELNITENEMTVTIPQGFLDNAVYPVKHAAGATFGYATIGASAQGPSQNKLYGPWFTTASDMGTVTKISEATVDDLTGSAHTKLVVVDKSTLNIVTNGVSSAELIPFDVDQHPNFFTDHTFASVPTLSPSTDYVMFVVHDDASFGNYTAYDTGASGIYYFDSSNSYTTPTNPTDAVNTGDDNGTPSTAMWSVYITYTPVIPTAVIAWLTA